MIHVHRRRVFWSSEELGRHVEPWRDGLTARDVLPAGVDAAAHMLWRGGAMVSPNERLSDGDHVTYAPSPGGFESFAVAKFLIWVAASTALNAILAPKLPPVRRGDEESPTYSFSGIGTARGEGFPIGKQYGTHRLGGVVISESLESEASPPKQTYRALISYGLGPYSAIGNVSTDTPVGTVLSTNDLANPIPTGIEINGNRAETYDDVEIQVRMGTPGQTAIPGFEFADTNVDVGQTLTSPTTTSASNDTYSLTNSTYLVKATSDTAFAANGRTQDYSSAAIDAARITVTFPAGLYTYDQTNGDLANSRFQLAVRYIELDGGGSPITTGGPEADGYVRLIPFDVFAAAQQGQFSVDYNVAFVDPQTFVHDTIGEAISFDGSNDAAVVAAPALPSADYVNGTNLNTIGNLWGEFSIGCWVRPDGSGTVKDAVLLDHISSWTGTPRGFRLGFRRVAFFAGIQKIVPVLDLGNGATTYAAYEGNANPSAYSPTFTVTGDNWQHLVATYQRNSSGSQEKIKIYANGKLRYTILTDFNCQSAGSGSELHIGHTRDSSFPSSSTSNPFFFGKIDEAFVINRQLSAQEITNIYKSSSGQYLSSAGLPQLVMGWHFDTSSGAAAWTTPDFATGAANPAIMYTNHGATTKGNLLTSSGGGKVVAPATNTPKRSRWRLECLRNNFDSVDASTQDEARWETVAWRIDEAFSYPGHALLAIAVRASEQLQDTLPDITARWDGLACPVWDGGSLSNPTFAQQYTAHPAWIAIHHALDPIGGLGQTYKSPAQIDILSFSEWAKTCDELVYGHHGQYGPGTGVGWTDIAFVNTAGVRTLGVFWDTDKYTRIRQYLEVGDYIGLDGVNVVSVDINTPAGNRHDETPPGGWQITAFNDSAKTMTLAISVSGDPWASGTLLSAHVGGVGSLTGTLEDREFRHRCHLNVDKQMSGWEWLRVICATGRARPVKDGSRLRVVFDRLRDAPSDIVTQSSIVEDSFSIDYNGPDDKPNAFMVDIFDADQNWERSPFPVEDESVNNATTGATIVSESKTYLGITSRAQAMRQATFELRQNQLRRRAGEFKCNVSALPMEPGDVVTVAHDLAGWSYSGRVATDAADETTVVIDREVVVTSALTTHNVIVKSSLTGEVSTGVVDTAATGSGGYPRTIAAGDTITLSTPLAFSALIGDEYSYSTPTANPIDVEIVGAKQEHNGDKTLSWLEYVPAVYTDDTFGDLTEVDAASGSIPSEWTIPPEVNSVGVTARHATSAGGQHVQVVSVSWDLERSTLLYVSRVAVWWRSADVEDDPWHSAGEVDASITSMRFELPTQETGATIQVAVQAISRRGARLKPTACAHGVIRFDPLGPAPTAPTSFSAAMAGDQAVYSFVPARTDRMLFTEVRRGGWILGQPVGIAPPGVTQIGPTRDWAGGPTNAWAESSPTLYARHVSPTGACSPAASLVFEPTVERTFALAQFDGESECAEDAFTTRTTLTDMATFTLPDGRTGIRFSGSALTGYVYWPATPITSLTPSRTRRVYVEAFVSAAQVHPWAFASWPAIDSPELRNWSMEGPCSVQDGDTSNCTLALEIKVADDSGSGEWKPFRPGVYRMKYCQLRAVVTRPDSTYDVHVYRACLRVLRVPVEHNSESGLDSRARAWAVPG